MNRKRTALEHEVGEVWHESQLQDIFNLCRFLNYRLWGFVNLRNPDGRDAQ